MVMTTESEASPFSLPISELAHDGRGIGFLSPDGKGRGQAVFVGGALPGQTVLCRIRKESKSFLIANLLEILEDNPEFQPPHCPHWQICGGCPLQRLPYASQLFWKEKIVLEMLRRIGRLPLEDIKRVWSPPMASPLLREYRNKVEFAFGYDSDRKPALGFRKTNSHEVFNLDFCAIIEDAPQKAAKTFLQLALDTGLPVYGNGRQGFWKFLILRQSSAKSEYNWLATCITAPGNAAQRKLVLKAGRDLLQKVPCLQAFIHEERMSHDYLTKGQKRVAVLDSLGNENPEAAILEIKLAGLYFRLDASNFFQVNAAAAEKLAQQVRLFAPAGGDLLDLYAGVGAPGLLLAKNYESVVALESDVRAVKFAEKNAGKISARYKAMPGDAGKNLERLAKRRWSAALMDPPRAGLDKRALRGLLAHAPKKLVYISCNPAALARDLNLLGRHYMPEQMASVDMFPHTAHLECVCLLSKRKTQ